MDKGNLDNKQPMMPDKPLMMDIVSGIELLSKDPPTVTSIKIV